MVTVAAPHLLKFKSYPEASSARGEEGSVLVTFTVDRNGRLLSASIYRPSRFKDLNKAALALVKKAAPYRPFPPGATQDRIRLTVPVLFRLNELIVSPKVSTATETIDCEALKNTTLPYQLKWNSSGVEFAKQVFREKTGDFVMWTWYKLPNGNVEIDVASFDARGSEGTRTNNHGGGPNKRITTGSISGFPKLFDRRSNVTYEQVISTKDDKGSTTQSTMTIVYEFLKEEKKAFGSCTLTLVHGRQRYLRNGKPEAWVRMYYLPELRGSFMIPPRMKLN